jgi:hypothetical protein
LKHKPVVSQQGEANLRMANRLEVDLMLDIAASVFPEREICGAPAGCKSERTRLVSPVLHHLHDVDLAAIHNDFGSGDGVRLARANRNRETLAMLGNASRKISVATA